MECVGSLPLFIKQQIRFNVGFYFLKHVALQKGTREPVVAYGREAPTLGPLSVLGFVLALGFFVIILFLQKLRWEGNMCA